MPNFAHLNKLNIKDGYTSEYPLHQIEGDYVLTMRSATEANKEYFNALLRQAGKKVKSKNVSIKDVKENREKDKVLFAKHVIVGWAGIKDTDGADVEFSEANVLEFLSSLPNWIFDDIRTHASDIQNFIPDEIVDIEGTAKN